LSIGDNYGYLSAAASDALWRAGYLYGVNGDAVSARQVFVRLAEAYPQSEWAVNGLFLAASTAVKNNESLSLKIFMGVLLH
jgi:TolA-binding protein